MGQHPGRAARADAAEAAWPDSAVLGAAPASGQGRPGREEAETPFFGSLAGGDEFLEHERTVERMESSFERELSSQKIKEVEEAMHAISAKLYEAAAAEMAAQEEAGESPDPEDDGVVDADFEVVDEED